MEVKKKRAFKLKVWHLCVAAIIIGFTASAIHTALSEAAFNKRLEQHFPPRAAHSNCQYPLRTTNPAGGCDNSDPCDASNAAKGGSGDCKTDS